MKDLTIAALEASTSGGDAGSMAYRLSPWLGEGLRVNERISEPATKSEERRAFVLLAVVLFPVLSVAVVGGYGFLVWMFQIINGPPTS